MSESVRPPFKDILQAIPGIFGIRLEEEPAYTVLDTVGEIEIRRYQPALLAQVTVRGAHDDAMNSAFTTLASYIYGKNDTNTTLHMTTPVQQEAESGVGSRTTPITRHSSGNGWTVSFFLSNDLLPEEAPQPDDPAVGLVMVPETVRGVLRFTGNNTEHRREASRETLLATIASDGRWQVADDVSWSQYDQPFAIPFLKRNEAQVALRGVSA